MMPMNSEVRAPHISLASMSRPSLSVPSTPRLRPVTHVTWCRSLRHSWISLMDIPRSTTPQASGRHTLPRACQPRARYSRDRPMGSLLKRIPTPVTVSYTLRTLVLN